MVSRKKQSEQQQVLIASVKKDLRDSERIENNIIISWLVQATQTTRIRPRDTHVKSQRRIKTNRRTRLNKPIDMIVVEFKNETEKNIALRGAKTLRKTA
ncbi:hypothetical protein BpHYR1_043379 [Brachionus plicatilis]|uniref:Uncharacterized protein n=1 Tax=Brachionus plicatilis TaxID=10195 RepID=A0A3M7QRX3_BRAPC|nr:hypothetical protein BpHYR1_043379 [Brachionus plicatilis]